MGLDEGAIKAAVKARRDYIVSNLDTMSLKSCRQTLEGDMGLEPGALKPYKDLLSTLIDKLIAKKKAAEAAAAAAAAPAAEEPEEEEEAEAEEEEEEEPEYDDESEEEEGGRTQKQRKRGGGDQPAKRQKREPAAKPAGPRQYGARVEKLRAVCRAATITIPPSLYVRNKSDEALEAALQQLLDKHGLDAGSGERAIAAAKARLQKEKELEGIDTSNIIEGGRRSRGAAPVSYRKLVAPDSEAEDSEEEEEESGSEGGASSDEELAGSDSDAEQDSEGGRPAKAKAARKQKAKQQPKKQQQQKKKRAASSEEEEEESEAESSEEEEEADSGSEEEAAPRKSAKKSAAAAAAAAAHKSPDENAAGRGNGGSAGKGSGRKPSAVKARPAASLEDSDGEEPVVVAGKRRDVAAWSDDDE